MNVDLRKCLQEIRYDGQYMKATEDNRRRHGQVSLGHRIFPDGAAFGFVRDLAEPGRSEVLVSDRLDANARRIIEAADTFFVASYVDRDREGWQVDVSHRGGRPGFVRVDADGGLTVPDFNGNLFFNTLGNFVINPRAGRLFVDHETGDMLQMTGTVEVILDSPKIAAFEGAERLWRVRPEKVVLRGNALPLRWSLLEGGMSPSSLMTGEWSQAESRLKVAAKARTWRRFCVKRAIEESSTIRSSHLMPVDGGAVIPHLAGQHLPIRTAGHCGDCRTRIVSGGVSYASEPSYTVADNEALICCSVPAQTDDNLQLDL